MRWLLTVVVVMGVLIIVGVATVGVTIVRRLSGPSTVVSTGVTLEEPAGTRMSQVAAAGDRFGILLSGGGGPDRVLLIDPHTGQVTGRIGLAR